MNMCQNDKRKTPLLMCYNKFEYKKLKIIKNQREKE